jgi:hypothetical protein
VDPTFPLFMRITVTYLPLETVTQFQWTLTAYRVIQKKSAQLHWCIYQVIMTSRINFKNKSQNVYEVIMSVEDKMPINSERLQ